MLHAVGSAQTEDIRIEDRQFSTLPEVLRPDDVLVLNNSKVIPSRFFPEGFGTKAEVLLLKKTPSSENTSANGEVWEALARPMKKFEKAGEFLLSPHLKATVCGRTESQEALYLRLCPFESDANPTALIEQEGSMPIPPYIRQGHADEQDKQRYQTVYADTPGSVAAPTAGLHFTSELFLSLRDKGVELLELTHHVGPASFLPVRDADWQSHQMSMEHYVVPEETLSCLESAKSEGRRIIPVGTTSVRALESFFADDCPSVRRANAGHLQSTELFITPGYSFKVVDALITNFHQPLSTHLLLVAAFIGVAQCEAIYRHALESQYRFLSYGDGMCLEKVS